MEIKTREDFINAVVQLLALRPNSHVMVLIDNEKGMEVLQTHTSLVWSFGLLAVAEKRFDEIYRNAMAEEANRAMEVAAEAELNGLVKTDGGVN